MNALQYVRISWRRWLLLDHLQRWYPFVWLRAPGSLYLPLLLSCLVFASALAVVRVEHDNRALTNELNHARAERDRAQIEWSQLQLEEATLAQNGEVEVQARTRLNMSEPDQYVVIEDRP